MGKRLSSHLKSKSPKPTPKKVTKPKSKRYPLLLESLMLQRIKKEYQADKDKDITKGATECQKGGKNNAKFQLLETNKSVTKKEESESLQKLLLEHVLHLHDHLESAFSNNSKVNEKSNGTENCDEDDKTVTQDKETTKITDFPILVVQRLLDFLNPFAILALRATCKATKAWIDYNDYILRDFELRIDSEICKYQHDHEPPHQSPWSNFAIPYIHLNSQFIYDTIDNHADIIWSLEIYAPKTLCSVNNYPSNHPRRLFEIVSRCKRLECLKICRFDTLTHLPEGNECFQCLRVLSIDRIQWMNISDFPLFEDLIMKCPLLEYLKVPEYEILGSLAFIFFDQNASPDKEHLIRPLIRYMDHYRHSPEKNSHWRKCKLYIDVVEFEDFKLCSSELFYELSRKCLECNAVLMNVYFVPRDAVLRDEQNIVESFASMFGFIKIDFHAELWKNLEVMECWIEDFPDDLDLTIRQFEFLKTVSKIKSLRSLTIRMSVDDPDICSGALEACIGQTYPQIKKLILRRHQVVPDIFVRIPAGFGNAFCDLRFLYFQELDARNEDFAALWPSLNNLEELYVYKCPYLTQEAFIGPSDKDEEASVLKLTKLQILVVFLYEGIGGFNDDFLYKGLRHMRLKGFALRGAAGVEFTDRGMLALLNSPFHDTIEDFEAPSSCFRPALSSNYWSFYIALPKKELRRNRIWLSCSVLLNSLSSRKHPYDYKRKCLGI